MGVNNLNSRELGQGAGHVRVSVPLFSGAPQLALLKEVFLITTSQLQVISVFDGSQSAEGERVSQANKKKTTNRVKPLDQDSPVPR